MGSDRVTGAAVGEGARRARARHRRRAEPGGLRRPLRASRSGDRSAPGDGSAGRSRRGRRRGDRRTGSPGHVGCGTDARAHGDPVPARRPARSARRRGLCDQRARQRHARERDAAQVRTPRRGSRYYAGWVDKLDGEVVPVAGDALDVVLPEPYGVVGAIVPWNGPMMGMGQKAAPALAAGNTVVVKPPEIAPFGALRFAELALDAGLPPGVLNVVVGGAAAGDALVRHRGIDKIVVHRGLRDGAAGDGGGGGDADAARLRARAASRPTSSSPTPTSTSRRSMAAVLGAVLLSGQGCALPTRLYVHDDVYDEVVGRVVAAIESVTVGDPLDPAVLMGPVVSERSCARILGVIERARRRGRGHAPHRRPPTRRRARRRLLRRADGVRRRRPRQRARPRRDLRPRALGPALPRRGRGRRQGERQRLTASPPTCTRATSARAHRVARRLEVGTVTVERLSGDVADARRSAASSRAASGARAGAPASRSSSAARTSCSARSGQTARRRPRRREPRRRPGTLRGCPFPLVRSRSSTTAAPTSQPTRTVVSGSPGRSRRWSGPRPASVSSRTRSAAR